MLDLLLTHAYFLAQDPHEQELMRPFPPLGIQYLTAWLRQAGFARVDWWDATFQPGPEAFVKVLDDTDPRAVGFYGHTITRPVAAGMIRRCRAQGRRVIAGGPDPVQYLDAYLDMGVEVVVIGEGEQTLQALVAHLAANRWAWDWSTLGEIDGIAFRAPDGTLQRTRPRALLRPLDRLPMPHRSPRDLAGYAAAWKARHGRTAMSMGTSRGCPYRCAWCSKQVYGDTFRRRTPGHVVDELLALRRDFDPDEIWFVDDMFTLNRQWVLDFCREKIRRDRPDSPIPFYLIGRAETLEEGVVSALAAAGCYRIYLSAESGSQKVLDAMEKGTDLNEIFRAGDLLRRHRIELGIFVMLGYPGEDRQDVVATLRMIRRLDPEVVLVSVAHPMKGTRFHEDVKDRVTGERGGRLLFDMARSPAFYERAQRLIWAEQAILRGAQRGDWRVALPGLIRWPGLRLGLEVGG